VFELFWLEVTPNFHNRDRHNRRY